MAMLAERKQKQKWTLNPRGKYWSDDSNKFGQKMLEKMGWSAGKGLGAKEDGITEHIKQSYKNDSKGIGFEDKGDQWTKHEVDFSSLLLNLGKAEDIQIKKPEISLEKKSQSSRARVHYHKFTRGKDLSRYSEKDLANVFGRKTLDGRQNIESINKETNSNSSNSNKEFGVMTVNAGSMADYFKTKNKGMITKTNDIESDEERAGFGFGQANTLETFKDTSTFKSKFKNMFMKFKDNGNTDTEKPNIGDLEENNMVGGANNDAFKDKKINNKTKVVINECFDNPGFKDFTDVELENMEKKRKNKHKKTMAIKNDDFNLDLQNEEIDHPTEKSKKRKLYTLVEESVIEKDNINRVNIISETNNEDCYTPPKKKSKKDKKKKEFKTHKGIDNKGCTELNVIYEEREPFEVNVSYEIKSSKKKKSSNTGCTERSISNEEISLDSDVKSSSKKKKNVITEVGIYNVACTEDNKDDLVNDSQERSVSEDTYEVKSSAKKKKERKAELGIDNFACTELDANQSIVNIEQIQSKSSKKSKKNKSKESGVDNPACTANSVQQNIEEAISSMSNAIDDYQLELENEMNERKVSKVESRKQKKINDRHLNFPKKSIKDAIKGELRYNFEGSNLSKIPGYGVVR